MRSRVEAHAGPYLARPIVLAAVALFALLAALVIAAPAHAQTPSVSPTASPTASPTGTAIPRTTVLAPIESLEVQALPSGVVQVVVVSGLPGGCAAFDSIATQRTGTRIDLTQRHTLYRR